MRVKRKGYVVVGRGGRAEGPGAGGAGRRSEDVGAADARISRWVVLGLRFPDQRNYTSKRAMTKPTTIIHTDKHNKHSFGPR